jgi:hypothetical protein
VFNLRFYGPANGMKFKARERTCNILEKIGQKAYHPNVKSTLVREMQSIDTPETIQAARAAHDAIFKKK